MLSVAEDMLTDDVVGSGCRPLNVLLKFESLKIRFRRRTKAFVELSFTSEEGRSDWRKIHFWVT